MKIGPKITVQKGCFNFKNENLQIKTFYNFPFEITKTVSEKCKKTFPNKLVQEKTEAV